MQPPMAQILPPTTIAGRTAADAIGAPRDSAGGNSMQQLIQLRWIAVVGQLLTIALVHFGLDIRLPLAPMAAVLAALAAFNLLAMLRWRRRERVTHGALLLGLLTDVAALTAQLYLSGGIANPFVFLYLLQVILGAVLLPAWATWAMVAVTTACFAALALWAQPLALPADHHRGLASPYMLGMLVCFALNAALLVTFIARIVGNLREHDLHLAALRQRTTDSTLMATSPASTVSMDSIGIAMRRP